MTLRSQQTANYRNEDHGRDCTYKVPPVAQYNVKIDQDELARRMLALRKVEIAKGIGVTKNVRGRSHSDDELRMVMLQLGPAPREAIAKKVGLRVNTVGNYLKRLESINFVSREKGQKGKCEPDIWRWIGD